MTLSAPFIKRPVATVLLAIAVFLAGAAAFFNLPVAPLPKVDFPTISVQAQLPGASPETMASAVATPLERRFGRIAGITEITSSSTLGTTSVTLQFGLDRDVESAARDVQAAINAASAELPPNLPNRPTWRKVNPADAPVLILSLTSQTEPLDKIFEVANTILAQKIAQTSGVGQVFVGGGQQPAVRVRVDPDVLAGAGYTLEDVRTAIGAATSNQPKGILSGPNQAFSVAANDQLLGADRWRSVVVGTHGGAVIRLGDVAQVFDDVENQRAAAWVNGERAVLLVIRRQPGANIISTIERVKALIPSLASSISPAVKVEVALDRSQSVRASVRDIERSLVFSVLLVIGVVFLFLRSVRASVIPTVVVPLSLVGTFGVMWLLDYSLDILSLMALTISTGFVVDDAIVVTENITRYIEAGEAPLAAALKGARQIGFTIVSITVSLLAVFIPLFLMSGMVGRLLREFVVTLATAISISALVSLTLTPMMCSRLLSPGQTSRGRFSQAFESAFGRLVATYERALRVALAQRAWMLLVTLSLVVLTVVLFVVMPKGLFPQQDNGMLAGSSEGPQDVAFLDMRRRQQEVNAIVLGDPDVAHVVGFIGVGPGGASTNTGAVFVELKPKPGRKATADEVINRLRPKLSTLPGTSLFLQAAQDIRIGGRAARSQYQYTLQDADLEELRAWAPKLLERLRKVPELRDVNTDQQSAGLELDLHIDRDTAARLGITPRQIDDTLYDAFGQRQVATSFTERTYYRVVMEVRPELQKDERGLAHLYLRSSGGGLVPLDALVTSRTGSLPLSVNHQGQFASVTLSFNLAPGVSLSQATVAIQKAKAELGLPGGVRAGFQGTAQAYGDSQSTQTLLILFALLVVYVVLGMLYESYVHPLTILSTLPSAGVGALLALMIFKIELSVVALVAIILLIGIVKKNAIMMVDFALEAERVEGLSPLEAMVRACKMRFRPILMTTLAALLGGLPLALGTGIGSELRKPLGIAIVGGLLVSQLVTMFTTPVVYLSLDRFSRHKRSPESTKALQVSAS
jgi:hydrophobe/amphiphile efflux-1 (HAE1) family protein